MLSKEWQVVAESDECVLVTINDDVDIEGLELTLISDVRIPIIKIKINFFMKIQ